VLTDLSQFRTAVGLRRVRPTQIAVLDWMRLQCGVVMWRADGVDSGVAGFTHGKQRQAELLRYMVFRWEQLGLDKCSVWYPRIAWSTERFLGVPASRTQHASWSRTVARLERRGLIVREGTTPAGHRRTSALQLTARGVEALHHIANVRRVRLDTRTIHPPRHLPEMLLVTATLNGDRHPYRPTFGDVTPQSAGRLRNFVISQYEAAARALLPLSRGAPGGTSADREHAKLVLSRLKRGPMRDFEIEAKALEEKLGLMPV
jgi:DNA-binding MarR family transcriptional regulator